MKIKNFAQKLNLYELMGIVLGDGTLIVDPVKRVYRFELNGNADDERDYYQAIADFLRKEYGVHPKVFVKKEKLGKTLRLDVNSKELASYFKKDLGLDFKSKTFEGSIPEKFLNWRFSRHIIRGIFETDGCLYFSRTKPTWKPIYPRIEIKTSSKKLAKQLMVLLKGKGFKMRQRFSKGDQTVCIYLSGKEMLQKWINEIGFSKTKTITKYLVWKKQGHYVPYMTLSERMTFLGEGAQAVKGSDFSW